MRQRVGRFIVELVTALQIFAQNHLSDEIKEVTSSTRKSAFKNLSNEQRAIIYKYTDDGYKAINQVLRESKGKNLDEFGKHLNSSLNKLPKFEGLIYRGVLLSKASLQRYLKAHEVGELIEEHCFVSCSKSRTIAMTHGNTLFRIFSRTGRDVELLSKYGTFGDINEKEVILKPNRKFRILEIGNKMGYQEITMEEVV